jgi:hypothetical protein
MKKPHTERPIHPRSDITPSFAIDFTYVPDKELLVAIETNTLFFIPIAVPRDPTAADVMAAIHSNLTLNVGNSARRRLPVPIGTEDVRGGQRH